MTAPCHIHAVIRQKGGFVMLYSGKYSYYKFPHGEKQPDETPEQALCRIVSAQTGLTALPESIRLYSNAAGAAENGNAQMHMYYCCKVSGAPDTVPDGDSRFTLREISRKEALAADTPAGHGILTDDAQFQAMLRRETDVLRSFQNPAPLLLSIAAASGSLLIPVIGGLSCLIFGFHSPTDGGYVSGMDAFEVGLILGIFPAGPAAAVSLAALILSLRDRHRAVHRPAAYILPLIALAVMLFFASAAFSFGGK